MSYTSNEVVIVVEQPPPPPPPAPAPSVTLSADKTRCYVGDTVTFTVKTTGLDGWYQINIVEKTVGIIAWESALLSSSGSVVSIQWIPKVPGTYYLHAEVFPWPVSPPSW